MYKQSKLITYHSDAFTQRSILGKTPWQHFVSLACLLCPFESNKNGIAEEVSHNSNYSLPPLKANQGDFTVNLEKILCLIK